MDNTRNTLQREIVYQAVLKLKNHPTAEEVYQEIRTEYPFISKATVYRNLKVLAGLGKLAQVTVPNGADGYDHQTHGHFHMHCTECGRLSDICMKEMPPLETLVEDSDGYVITGCEFMVNGICPECQRAAGMDLSMSQ